MREYLLPVLILIVARGTLGLFQVKEFAPLQNSALFEGVFDVAVLLISISLVRWTTTWGVPAMMSDVRDIGAVTQAPGRTFLRDFATNSVATLRAVVTELCGDGYVVHDPTELKSLFEAFFAHGGGDYIGVDTHMPLEYMTQYEWYLAIHAASLPTPPDPVTDRRILVAPQGEFVDETHGHGRGAYLRFRAWHIENRVDVGWTDAAVANALRSKFKVSNANVGLWRHFAVVFAPGEDDTFRIQMWFPSEREHKGTTYEELAEFVRRVATAAVPLDEVAPELDLVNQELARAWPEYVNPDRRLGGKMGVFLDALRDKRTVFDAAAGIGCDSVYLAQRDHLVVANEVDARLRAIAEEYARHHGVKLSFHSHLWQDLPDNLPQGWRFDAVLCLGNSLCLVREAAARRQCIGALRDCLAPGGVLIVDERNFQAMLDNATEINADPLGEFPPALKGDVMYCGVRVRGYPAAIDDKNAVVRWRFFRNQPAITSVAEMERDMKQIQGKDLQLHAFRHGELFSLLHEAGFAAIDVFADLEAVAEGVNTMPEYDRVQHAFFLTYVAHA